MLRHNKGQYQDIHTKWLRFQQDKFKFQDNFEISGQLGPMLIVFYGKDRKYTG